MVRDLTGSGKTLGFCLPMVEIFRRERLFGKGKPLAMILAPTRELALQISKELEMLKHNPRDTIHDLEVQSRSLDSKLLNEKVANDRFKIIFKE